MSKILVIGCNSFSGSSFIGWLLKKGIDVVGISRSDQPNSSILPHSWVKSLGRFRFIKMDINNDLDQLQQLIIDERFAIIFNFAAQSMVGESWAKPEDWMRTNVLTAASLAQRLSQIDFIDRYVHITTPEVYGSTDGWIDESTHFNPSTPYAVSRAAGDMIFKIYQESYNLPVISTRAANVYGPGQQLYRIIPRTIYMLLTNQKLQLHGGGLSTRSFIHMDDVSNATWLIANGSATGETYHISTDSVIAIRDLVRLICNLLNKDYNNFVNIVDERVGKDSAYWLDSSKLRTTLNWKDQISLEEGLIQTISWVKDNLEALSKTPLNYIHKS